MLRHLAAGAAAIAALALGIPASSAATAWPVPQVSSITTYSTTGTAVILLHAEPGAVFRWQLGYQAGTTSKTVITVRGLTADAAYPFRAYAYGAGRTGSHWSQVYPVNPITCAVPPPYGPEPQFVARTTVWDRQSWLGWSDRYTPGEFENTMAWLGCENYVSPQLPIGTEGAWLDANYINAENFTAPMPPGIALWHLAAP